MHRIKTAFNDTLQYLANKGMEILDIKKKLYILPLLKKTKKYKIKINIGIPVFKQWPLS